MKSFNLFIVLVLSFHTLMAQETTKTTTSLPPQLIVKFSPINLVDFDTPGFAFSVEHQLRENHYLHHEVNLLTSMGYVHLEDPILGYRFRTGYRHYYNGLTDNGTSNKFYEILIKFKQTFQKKTATFSRFDGAFAEDLPHRTRTTSVGIYGACGKQYFLGSGFTLELGFTLGWRFLQKQNLDLPSDAKKTINNFALFSMGEGAHSFPSTYLLCKVGYIIK